jgi:xanthine dehydrogenase accessory factor
LASSADPVTARTQPVDGPPGQARPATASPGGPGGRLAHADLVRLRADALRARRMSFVQATVVRAIRPTSAKAGDRALVLPDGTLEGFVGGSCAESSVRLHGLRVLRDREPVVLRITPEAPPLDIGPGPGGGGAPERDQAGQEAAAGLVTVTNPCASGGMLEIFLEGVFPPPLVQVLGDAPIARALRAVGEALGYEIRPPGGPGEELAPDASAVIVASHGREEEPLLTLALRAGVPYVGLVASRRRGAAVAAALEVPTWDRQRLRTPAGLDIGARTPEEIALSIFAEIVSQRSPLPTVAPAAEPAPGKPRHQHAPGPATDQAGGEGAMPLPGETVPAGRPAPGGAEPRGQAPPDVTVPRGQPPPGVAATVGEATDPVCGMIVAMAQATPHLAHDGHMWYFCGPGCRQAFADDPARYSVTK